LKSQIRPVACDEIFNALARTNIYADFSDDYFAKIQNIVTTRITSLDK